MKSSPKRVIQLTQENFLYKLLEEEVIDKTELEKGINAIENNCFKSYIVLRLGVDAYKEWEQLNEQELSRLRSTFWEYFEKAGAGGIDIDELLKKLTEN